MDYMARALELAERALGVCSPNPAVGAVLVREGRIVGEGWTKAPGQGHAEIVALQRAGDDARGATLYVTLEPCSHYGRTPPCIDAILAAGVRAVHLAMIDPSPWVAGGGLRALEGAGVEVVVGEHEPAARRLNESYFKFVSSGLPFVTVKWAMTLDGKIAAYTGDSRWVTGEHARARVARLRAHSDAVLVGVGTVLMDDPQLTVRRDSFAEALQRPLAHLPDRQPLRVVLDSLARTPLNARLVSPELPGKTLLLVTDRAPAERVEALRATAAEVLVVPDRDGRVHPRVALRLLAERSITSVLVEAGGTLVATLLESRVVDKVCGFVAPKIIGGATAPTPVEGLGCPAMHQALGLRDVTIEQLGEDLLIEGYVSSPLDESDWL